MSYDVNRLVTHTQPTSSSYQQTMYYDHSQRRGGDWLPIGTIAQVEGPVCSLALDTYDEMVWIGHSNGRITSYNYPSGDKYCSFRSFDETMDVKQTIVQRDNILSLSSNSFTIHSKGGILSYSFTSDEFNDQLLAFTSYNHSPSYTSYKSSSSSSNSSNGGSGSTNSTTNTMNQKVALGGNLNTLFSVDLSTGSIVDRMTTNQGICVLKSGVRYVASGGIMGELAMRDPRSLRAEHTFDAHSGSISDIEMKGDLLVTCGYTSRYGELYVDPIVKAFDLRTMRMLGQIHFPAGPAYLKFHPMFSSQLSIVSQSGYFQFKDIQSEISSSPYLTSDNSVYSIDLQGEAVECFDMSSSGEVLMFGDSAGCVHVFSLQSLQMNDQNLSCLNKSPVIRNEDPGMPDGEELLSTWPMKFTSLIGQYPSEIHPQILANLNTHTSSFSGATYGIALNPGLKKSSEGYLDRKTFMNYMNQRKSAKRHKELNVIPRDYNFIEAHTSSRLRGYEFDYSKYNKTPYVGLENQIEHTHYCNAFIQLIYHLHKDLRTAIMNHCCEKPLCLSCELSFLFYMFQQVETSKETVRTIAASNFLRTLKRMYAEKMLPSEIADNASLSAGERAHLFNQFIWGQLHAELANDLYPYSSGFPFSVTLPAKHPAMSNNHTTTSTNNSNIQLLRKSIINTPSRGMQQKDIIEIMFGASVARESNNQATSEVLFTHQLKLTEPTNTTTTFADLITSALNWDTRKTPTSYKTLVNLPNVLSLTYGVDQEDLMWLRRQHLRRNGLDLDEHQYFKSNSKVSIPPKFTVKYNEGHMNWRVEDISYDLNESTTTFSQSPKPTRKSSARKLAGEGRSLNYVLRAAIVEIKHPFSAEESRDHCVTFVNIPNENHEFEWHLFNDFTITRHESAYDFSQSWKNPCVLFYAREDIDKVIMPKPLEFVNPILAERVFSPDFMPIDPSKNSPAVVDIPERDDIVSIDAEFVVLEMDKHRAERKKSSLNKSGDLDVSAVANLDEIRPVFSLGRVSVLLDNPRFDILIDDFIGTRSETVHDYMTRFSGLKPGDLDYETSPNNVTHLKATYMKLRALVDRGVRFVGHGLQNDFKISNLFVPKSQIIDTVELFQLPNQRKISLRFLANFLLHSDIQQEIHCSVEDARTALQLYHKYLEATSKNEFSQLLNDIYAVGRNCNWQVENAQALKNSLTVFNMEQQPQQQQQNN